jgi:23S rRNA pseudouridine1911/1915/1917 synthase
VGHPVVGDPLYGRVQPPQPPRIFLHAAHLALAHPVTGVPLTFTSPLPDDLAAFLARLAGE